MKNIIFEFNPSATALLIRWTPGPSRIAMIPKDTEEFLDGPGPRYL